MPLFPPDVFSAEIMNIRNRGVSPKCLHGLGFLPSLRKFALVNSAFRRGAELPIVRLHRSNDGTMSVHDFDKVLLSVIEIYRDRVPARITRDIPREIVCRNSKAALEMARLGYVAIVKYPNGRETFRLDDGMIEHIVRMRDGKSTNTMYEYVDQHSSQSSSSMGS